MRACVRGYICACIALVHITLSYFLHTINAISNLVTIRPECWPSLLSVRHIDTLQYARQGRHITAARFAAPAGL